MVLGEKVDGWASLMFWFQKVRKGGDKGAVRVFRNKNLFLLRTVTIEKPNV